MSHPVDMPPERPTPETHERVGSVWIPKAEAPIPTSAELADRAAMAPPLLDASELMARLDVDSKNALAKAINPSTSGDERNFWCGVLYMSGRVQHRLIFKVEPPDEGKERTNEA